MKYGGALSSLVGSLPEQTIRLGGNYLTVPNTLAYFAEASMHEEKTLECAPVNNGAMTVSKTTLSLTTLSLKTLSIMTLNCKPLIIKTQHNDTQHNNTQLIGTML
jgi:hypothetical protein